MLANHTSIASVSFLPGIDKPALILFQVVQADVGPIRQAQKAQRLFGSIQERENI